MINQIKQFFFKPGTNEIQIEKVVSTAILILGLVGLFIYGRSRNAKKDVERNENALYTIGTTLKQYKSFRSPNPTVKYEFKVNSIELTDFEEIPDYLHGRIVTEGGRYFVQYSSKNPHNCKLLLESQVPDTLTEAPVDGWEHIPIVQNK